MAWLRSLMEDGEPPVLSFGSLARTCLAHPDWPQYSIPQPRSLAALFSKFDRGLELEWLYDRPDVQHVLAAVLGCPAGAVLRPLNVSLGLEDRSLGRHRFADAPAARPLVHVEEPLPPGLPPGLAQPHTWTRCSWRAASVEEFELVGGWLAARGLAQVSSSAGYFVRDQLACAPPKETLASAPRLCLTSSAHELTSLACDSPVCIALLEDAKLPPGFRTLSFSFQDQIPALVDWFRERQPGDGQLAGVDAVAWLERAWAQGVVDGFESAIGLLAALDEVPTSPSTSWGQLAEQFVRLRVSSASIVNRGEATWLANNGIPLLIGLIGETFEQQNLPWDRPRDIDAWLELMPSQFHGAVNARWAKTLFDNAGVRVEEAQLERALASVPPGSFALLRGLEAAGLLRGGDELSLGPRWLGLRARQGALEALMSGPPERWGEALLNPHAASGMRQRLQAELSSDSSRLLDSLLDSDDDESLAAAIAVETAFDLVGLAVCNGEEFDREQLDALWQKQMQLVVEFDDGTCAPRVLCAHDDPPRYGEWLLACWTLSEQLERPSGCAACAPWDSPDKLGSGYLDAVAEALLRSGTQAFREHAYSMLTRLFSSNGRDRPLGESGAPDPSTRILATDEQQTHALLLIPMTLLAPTWERYASLDSESVSTIVGIRGRSKQWVASVWELWLEAGCPSTPNLLTPNSAGSETFWQDIPERVLNTLLQHNHSFLSDLPYAKLSRDSFAVLVDYDTGHHPLCWAPGAMARVPKELVRALSLRLGAQSACVRELWQHHEHQLVSLVGDAANDEQFATVRHLLENANPATPELLMSLIRERLARRGVADPIARGSRRWLQSLSGHPTTLRAQAHQLLSEIESRLARAQFHEKSSH